MRAAPRETARAARRCSGAGDWLEVRGERPGFCRSTTTGTSGRATCGRRRCARIRVDEASARELAAVVRFLRDAAGRRVAGHRATRRCSCARRRPSAVGGRAVRRARQHGRPAGAARVGEAGAATTPRWPRSRGGRELRRAVRSFVDAGSRDGEARLCYDGEACPARAGAAGVAGGEGARGARAHRAGVRRSVARRERARDAGGVAGRRARQGRRASTLPAWLGNRVRVRAGGGARAGDLRAGAQAATGRRAGGERRSGRAALALVDKPELADDDALAYDEAAVRVGGGALGGGGAAAGEQGRSRSPRGKPGETCVRFAKRRALHLRRGVAVVAARCRRAAMRWCSRSRRCRRGRSWWCCGAGTSRRRWRRRRSIPSSAMSSSPACRPTARGCAWRAKRA